MFRSIISVEDMNKIKSFCNKFIDNKKKVAAEEYFGDVVKQAQETVKK